jgi:alginate O-acetyltransferase complex protein AlgI
MSISQIDFWLFIALMLTGYSTVRDSARWRYPYLFLGSLVFFYALGGAAVALLVFFTFVVYLLGLAIGSPSSKSRKKWWLVTGVSMTVATLFYFKYVGFFGDALAQALGRAASVERGSAAFFLLPLGISYYTLQAIGYLVDVYRGHCMPLVRFSELGFYLAFFPRVVAGPILRTADFFPQMAVDQKLTSHELHLASFLIFKGLGKKILVADTLGGLLVDRVFDNPSLYSGAENAFAALGYSLQLYADFSGYMDIMSGVALLFGFRLPPNFLTPMKAVNFGDFYRRWHHTLHLWLKEYVYKPLGGDSRGPVRTYLNIAIVFLLSGLWHGPAWTFIIFGALNAGGMIGYRIWKSGLGAEKVHSSIMRFGGIFATFGFATYTRTWFRAESVDQALEMTVKLLSPGSLMDVASAVSRHQAFTMLLVLTLILVFAPEKWKDRLKEEFTSVPLVAKAAAFALFIWWVGVGTAGVAQPFIYSRF